MLGGVFILIAAALSLLSIASVDAVPTGPSVTFIMNETAIPSPAAVINTTGGSITTVNLNATSQNLRWKAYIGNVSGKMTLENSFGFTVFDWSLTVATGEVYASRSPSVNWSSINCSNATQVLNEELAMNHTGPDDNISVTFQEKLHDTFYVGTREMRQDSCFSVNTYVNSTRQVGTQYFEEILLYDGLSHTGGNLVYATRIEQHRMGFDTAPYDFQMIVPERGEDGYSGSTAYYFYIEIT